MMKRVMIFLVILCVFIPVDAQNDCGNGLPCGPIPWRLPQLPELNSPTPFPTVIVNPTSTPNPLATNTPVPTNTLAPTLAESTAVDVTDLEDRLATLEAIIEVTDEPIIGVDGEEFEVDDGELETNMGSFFGYVRGISLLDFGVLNPIIAFLLFSFVWTLFIKSSRFILPFLSAIFGFIRRVIEFILSFIPGL